MSASDNGWQRAADYYSQQNFREYGGPFKPGAFKTRSQKTAKPPEHHVNPGQVQIGKPSRFKTAHVIPAGVTHWYCVDEDGRKSVTFGADALPRLMAGRNAMTIIPIRSNLIYGGNCSVNTAA